MTKRFNPLLDDKRPQDVKITASDSPPLSPFSHTPMVKALCGSTPVYVDMEKRVVVPIKRTF